MRQTVVYLLSSGAIDHSTTGSLEAADLYVDKTKFGVIEVDPDATIPTVANRLVDGSKVYVADGILRVKDPLPNIPILKDQRVTLLGNTDWFSIRHRDQIEAGIPTSLTPEQFTELMIYRQALRDWPTSGDFSESFPTPPPWMQ